MTALKIQRTLWAKWKKQDYHRHLLKRRLHRKLYMRRWRANQRRMELKAAA